MTLSLHRDDPVAEDAPLPGMIGEHASMKAVYRLVRRVAPTDLPVLIVGETGTGKELVAQAVHALSGRPGPLVAFNVCAIADTMFEDAVFGHVKGAFTGATSDAPGYLAEAHHGTAFFDEVGGMPLGAQVKVLRAVETCTFRPVGGRADRRSDFRVVAATSADLRGLVDRAQFRQDLLERLRGMPILLPPLRDRPSDVPFLARTFLSELDHGGLRFADDALATMAGYGWPGNVRELRNAVRRAVALTGGRVVDRSLVEAVLSSESRAPGEPGSASRAVEEALLAHGGNARATARALGISRSTLYERMRKAGLLQRRRGVSGCPGHSDTSCPDTGHGLTRHDPR